jgi:predicted hydrocarbon binding protein
MVSRKHLSNDESAKPNELAQKTPFIAELLPGRQLVEFTVTLANTPGALESVAAVLRKHRINVLSGFHTTERWSFFADITDSDVSPASLVDEVKSIGIVSSVRSSDSSRGFMIDYIHFPLAWEGKPMLLMAGELLGAILGRVREIFGVEGAAGKVLVCEMGKAAGHAMFKIIKQTQIDRGVEVPLPDLLKLYSAIGWGLFKLTQVDPKASTATLQVTDNFECVLHRGEGRRPYSEFIRGHLEGLFSDLFQRNVSTVETECLAHGDTFCEFKIEPMETAS